MDLVDWIIFTVGRLTVGPEMKWTPKSISNGNNKWALPCIAGIGFVIENEMRCFVFIFRPLFFFFFLYCRLQPCSFACYDFRLKAWSRLISAPFSFYARISIKVSLWKVAVISTRWFIVFKRGRLFHLSFCCWELSSHEIAWIIAFKSNLSLSRQLSCTQFNRRRSVFALFQSASTFSWQFRLRGFTVESVQVHKSIKWNKYS